MDRLIALVGMRWRTDLRLLLRRRERLVGLVVALPMLLVGSSLGALLVYFGLVGIAAAHPGVLLPLVSGAATGIGLFWMLSPILTAGAVADSHDVSRLLAFPIPVPTLALASFLSNLAQPRVLLELPVALAAALALSDTLLRVPIVFASLFLTLLLMLAAAQVSSLVLHGLTRDRRFRDVAMFLALGLGFLLSAAPLLLLAGAAGPTQALLRSLVTRDVFVLSPFAWGVRAAVYAGQGAAGPFLLFAGLALAALLLALALSGVLIQRIHRGEVDLGRSAAAASAPARTILPGTVGALLEKDLRATWRDPAMKAALVMGVVWPLLFLFVFARPSGPAGYGTSVLVLASFVGLSGLGANAFGLERRGILLLMSFPLPRWRILVAKNLGAALLRLPGLATLLLAALLLAPVSYVPAALTIVISTMAVASGLDNFVSILFPFPAPPPGAMYSTSAARGRGLGGAALGALAMIVALLVSSPFAFLAWLPLLLREPMWWILSLPLGIAGAAAVYAMLAVAAARLLERREPELLEAILVEE